MLNSLKVFYHTIIKDIFLNIKIENKGDTLVGEFHSNDGNIIDQFRLNKT